MSSYRVLIGIVLVGTGAALTLGSGPAGDKPPALPDNKTIDSITLRINAKSQSLGGPIAWLVINRDGKVTYNHSSQPYSGSGGTITDKKWDITPKAAIAILDGVVADGVLELPVEKETSPWYSGHATHGRWSLQLLIGDSSADKLHKRVLPLLRHAHPEAWPPLTK